MEFEIEAGGACVGLVDDRHPFNGGVTLPSECGSLTPGQRYRVTVTPADAPRSLGLTFERAQAELPWTVPYSAELEASSSAMPHIHASHAVLHVAKSAGKLAAVYEHLDHAGGEVSGSNLEVVKASASSLVMCALRIANLHKFSLEDALCAHVLEKNGAGFGGTTAPADAPRPEPVAWVAHSGKSCSTVWHVEKTARQVAGATGKVVPLYEHPPAEEVEVLRKRIAELEAQLADAQKVENECHRGVVYGLESLVERITDTKDAHCFHEEDSPVAAAEKAIRAHFEHPPISAEPPTARELFEDGWRASFNVHKRYLEKNEDFASRNYDVSHELWTAIYDMEHPPAPVDAKPVAYGLRDSKCMWATYLHYVDACKGCTESDDTVVPLYEHPPAPADASKVALDAIAAQLRVCPNDCDARDYLNATKAAILSAAPAPVDAKPAAYAIVDGRGKTTTCRTERALAEKTVRQYRGHTIEPLYRHPSPPDSVYQKAVSAMLKTEFGVDMAPIACGNLTHVADAIRASMVPVPPAPVDPHQDKPETLAERMHREGWRTQPVGNVVRSVDGAEQSMWPHRELFEAMRDLETPPAVKIARQLHSEWWRSGAQDRTLCRKFAGQLRSIDIDADIDAAMREIEKEENQP